MLPQDKHGFANIFCLDLLAQDFEQNRTSRSVRSLTGFSQYKHFFISILYHI